MSHEKRFLLAMGLTIVFLYVWFEFMVPKPKPKPVAAKFGAEVSATPTVVAGASASAPVAPTAAVAAPVTKVAVKKEYTNDLYSAVLTSQPGAIESLTLSKYHRDVRDPESHVQVVPLGDPAKAPLNWAFAVDGVSVSDDELAYATVKDATFKADLLSKVSIQKTAELAREGYVSSWLVELTNYTASPVKLSAKTSVNASLDSKVKSGGFLAPRETPIRAATYINDETHHWTLEDLQKTPKIPVGDIAWAGFDSQYFLLAALPEQGRWESMSLAKAGDRQMQLTLNYPEWTLEAGKTLTYKVKLYAGPKDISSLQKVAPHFDRAIDLGNWLGLVARPMLSFLRWVHGLIPNYGVAIILLTIFVRLLLTPLTAMQAKSMKRMQEHKPMMDELKERFKDDKEAYSRELMTYMRTNKINPMGGCLLLLPQLPIFFALYRVLYNSIELRHEPFLFWIRDLAAHDPYFVLPVLLGVAMFFQQKLTPTPSADEAQQMMMKIMPVMFTVFMLFLPAGLNLYILVSTLWGVAQQYNVQYGFSLTNKSIKKVS